MREKSGLFFGREWSVLGGKRSVLREKEGYFEGGKVGCLGRKWSVLWGVKRAFWGESGLFCEEKSGCLEEKAEVWGGKLFA